MTHEERVEAMRSWAEQGKARIRVINIKDEILADRDLAHLPLIYIEENPTKYADLIDAIILHTATKRLLGET